MNETVNLNWYPDWTKTTAIYNNVLYPFVKVWEELDELNQLNDSGSVNDVIKELGDVGYYIGAIGISLSELTNGDFGYVSLWSSICSNGCHRRTDMWHSLAVICGKAGKITRDGYAEGKYITELTKQYTTLLKAYHDACLFCGGIEYILGINKSKLEDRKRRGVISGDGDNR